MRAGSIHAVVAIFPGALGDLLLALPTLRAIRSRHAQTRSTLVVAEPLRAIARAAGVAETVESLDGSGTAWLFGADGRPPWLAGRPAVYSWLGARDAFVAARLASVDATALLLAVERGADGPHAAVAYARCAGMDVRHWRDLVPAAGISVPSSTAADALLDTLSGPVLLLHRGAGAPAKRWPAEAFAAVARWWRADVRGAVVDLAGPAEAGAPALPGTVAIRDWSLVDVAALAGRVAAYVGNDSGVSHLAGAVGARGAVVFRTTAPCRWRPLSRTLLAVPPPAHGRDRTVSRVIARLATLTSPERVTIDRP